MSTVAKILVVVNLILAAAFVGSASTYLGNQDHWKKKFEDAQALAAEDLKQANKAKDEAVVERDRARNAETESKGQKDEAVALFERVKLENTALKNNYDRKTASLDSATKALENLSKTAADQATLIEKLKDNQLTLESANTAIKADRDAAREQVNRLGGQLANETRNRNSLAAELAGTKETLASTEMALEAYRARYGSSIAGAPQPQHMGRILAARSSDNVYVISLGAEDGVKPGFQYVVSRGDDYVATIQITNVQSKQSAGTSVKDVQKGEIRSGDVVIAK